MNIKKIYIVFLISFFMQTYGQISLQEPNTSTEAQDKLIQTGIRFHDAGKYDQAIETYKDVLKENPANIVALYELSYTLTAKKDYEGALKYAMAGIKYKSKYLPMFYVNIGSILDAEGKPEEAISIYREGIQMNPDFYLLPYNLGISFYFANQLDSARYYFHKALQLKPTHASSNLALAKTYLAMGKDIPTLFSLTRFLILEPDSKRSKAALDDLQNILRKSISVDTTNPKNISITITPDSDDVDGDLSCLEMSLAITQASRFEEANQEGTDLQWMIKSLESFFQIMLELTENESFTGFCWEYYVPYFVDMQKHKFIETFVYQIFQSSNTEEIINWLGSNKAKIKDFIEWNKNYRWK